MDGRGLPAGHVVAHTVVGLELLQLLRFEDLQRQPTGRPMNAQSGYFAAPVLGLLTAVVQVAELPTLKEALTHVLDAALDVGFILRPAHPGGVDQEATLLAVLQEAACRSWSQCIWAGDGGGEVIEDEPPGQATEEAPRHFQPFDALLQGLLEQWCG